MSSWGIYKGTNEPHDDIEQLPQPPAWRALHQRASPRGVTFQASPEEIELVNAALYLRRPLLITGKPGVGKSSLAHAVAHELKLGPVLRWPITTRSTLAEGLYSYDAIGRLQEANLLKLKQDATVELPDIGRYLRLGPLGTALLPSNRPRVLLVDEIDKSDIDLPNDLLHVFEEGEFVIPEVARLPADFRVVWVMTWDGDRVPITGGAVQAQTFPFVVFTSNGEREFPPAFLRRCLRLTMQPPSRDKLLDIVEAHLHAQAGGEMSAKIAPLIDEFLKRREQGDLATDQLLNAIYLATQNVDPLSRKTLVDAVLRSLSS
jgi:MoxR-like ATPase